jgi:DNA-binding MarR family transcriptional regulator
MTTNKSFFKPTQLYKEYMILDLIEKNKDITQRELASYLGIAVSMVNLMLDSLEKSHYLKRKKESSKVVDYILTKQGFERRKLLNIGYLDNSLKMLNSAKKNLEDFLTNIFDFGFNSILLYGAGEVAEILLRSIDTNNSLMIKVKAIIDDNIEKQNKKFMDVPVVSFDQIINYEHDGIFISSYTHHEEIYRMLLNKNYPKNKIINYFN